MPNSIFHLSSSKFLLTPCNLLGYSVQDVLHSTGKTNHKANLSGNYETSRLTWDDNIKIMSEAVDAE